MSEVFQFIKSQNHSKAIMGNFWKIHVSPCLQDFVAVKQVVEEIACQYDVTYKYANGEDALFLLASVNAPLTQAGKLMTIYPSSEEEARRIMQNLYEQLKSYDGIEVVSDRPYRDSKNIWYRYGVHIDDHSVEDQRTPYFSLPEGIEDVFKTDDQFITGSLVQKKYQFLNIVRRKTEGNIYLATDANGHKVIIKEARKNIYVSREVLKTQEKENEYQFIRTHYKELSTFLPTPIDKVEEYYSIFYVYEYCEGRTLENFPAAVSFIMASPSEKSRQLKSLMLEMLNIMDQLTHKGIMHLDIHPGNFILNKGDIHIVDLEYCDSETPLFKTSDYWLPSFEQEDAIVQNFRRLGMLMLYLMGNINCFLYETGNIDRALYLALYKSVTDCLDMSIAKTVCYLLSHPYPTMVEARSLLIEEKASYSMMSTIDQLLLQETSSVIMESDLSDMVSGVMGLGAVIARGHLSDIELEKLRDEVSTRKVIRCRSQLVMRTRNGRISSPYLRDGAAGLIWAMLLQPQTWKKEDIVDCMESISFPDAKAPGLMDGLLGMSYVFLKLYKRYREDYLLKMAEKQLFSAINYAEFSNGQIAFRRYRSATIDNSVWNGFSGFELVYQFYQSLMSRSGGFDDD